jgi:hypothetical protein
MRHAVFVALLALATSSLSLTAEARWHHRHHHRHHHQHHHRHYRHVRHHRHYLHVRHHVHYRRPFYYLHTRRIGQHHRHDPAAIARQLSPAQAAHTPLSRHLHHAQAPAYAASGQPSTAQHRAALPRKSPVVAAAPAPATGQAKTVASAPPAKRVPDWKYPPATIKPVPGGKHHVLAPDTGSFVIIPGYKIVK